MTHFLFLTVDTELSNLPAAQGLWGKVGADEYGIRFILDLFKRVDIKGTFFVDVFGNNQYDIKAQHKACDLILKYGQDIQLHTHPAAAFDQNRPQMRQYTFEEQVEILEFGANRIKAWTGTRPVAHRAGDWAGNIDTLRALKTAGFKIDSSICAWGNQSDFPKHLFLLSGCYLVENILKIPPTCYYRRFPNKIKKLDVNGCVWPEVKAVLSSKQNIVVQTLHSFSFLGKNNRPLFKIPSRKIFWPDAKAIKNCRLFVDFAREVCGYHFLSFREAAGVIFKNINYFTQKKLYRLNCATDFAANFCRVFDICHHSLKSLLMLSLNGI